MNTRITKQSVLLLIAFCVLACSAGAQIRPGHRILNKVYVRSHPFLPSGAPTNGLEAEYVQGNWSVSDGTHIDVWYDSSRVASNVRALRQPAAVYQAHLLSNGRADAKSMFWYGGYGGYNVDVATACYSTGEVTFVIRGVDSVTRSGGYKFFLTLNATPQPLLFAVNDNSTRFKTFSPSGAWEGNTVYPGAPNGGPIKTFGWSQKIGVKKEWFNGTSLSTLNTSDSTFTSGFSGYDIGSGGSCPEMEVQDMWIYSRILSEAEYIAIGALP